MAVKKEDGRKNNGGIGDVGRKPMTEEEKKTPLTFYIVTSKHEEAKKKIKPIVDKLNKK